MKKQRIESNILSTMVGPLYARGKYSEIYPEILIDNLSQSIYEKVEKKHPDAELEFGIMKEFVDEFSGLGFLVRARTYDDAVMKFIEDHPDASVVNIGCGLDTSFDRVDNGRIKWYNLDLPEAIEYRRTVIGQREREYLLEFSFLDEDWLHKVEFEQEKGIICFAGGLLNYFTEKEVVEFFKRITFRFPGGEFIFDVPTEFMNKVLNKKFQNLGVDGVSFQFGLKKPEKFFAKRVEEIQVIDWFPMYSRIPINQNWEKRTKKLAKIVNRLKLINFFHLKFGELV